VANESAPYGLAAAVILVVGASAAIPAALFVSASAEPAVAAAGAADASPPAPARTPTTEREDAGAAAPLASAAPSSAPATPTPPPPPSGTPSAKPAASDAEASGPGFLTIITTPPAKASVHGRVLCTTTPCSKLALPAGSHTLTLENKEDASKTIVTVTVTSGETTVKRVKLKAAPTAP
jgi:eukaryotic-like serine/threonine-protein kinase